MTITLGPLVSLIAGILILIMPRLLNYIVALYLIIIGVIGLFVCIDRYLVVGRPVYGDVPVAVGNSGYNYGATRELRVLLP